MNKQQVFNEFAKLHWQSKDLKKEIYELENKIALNDENWERYTIRHMEATQLLIEVLGLMACLREVLEKMS